MTSEERREARYQRRKAKRQRKSRAYLDRYDDFSRAASTDALVRAHWDSKKGVMWKYAPALYDKQFIKNSAKSSERLYQGEDVCQGFYNFPVRERGKVRDVHSVHYTERVIRRSFCIECLVPILSHNLIHDNGASLKGKGSSFAEDRLTTHLLRHYRKYGDNEGYIVLADFKSYFANIRHDKLFENLDRYILDQRLNRQTKLFVKAGDWDKLEEKKGVGLYIGPEDSQILAVSYPNSVDHYVKDQLRQKSYARYNDDSYVIVRTKEEAQAVMAELLRKYDEHGIIPNQKKTQIVKLSRGFTFLKIKWFLTGNGKVVRKPDHSSIVRERRKLKKQRRFLLRGEMTLQQVCQSYMSWRGYIKRHRNSGRTILSMDSLFCKLYHAKPWKKQRRNKK